MIRERNSTDWGIPRRAVHKVYRTAIETPRRNRIAAKVFDLPPSPPVDESHAFTTHMLVCRSHVVMAVCTAKVSNLAFGISLPWVFHDDGSLRDEDEAALREHLPGCTVARREESDMRAQKELAEYPRILEYRRSQVMALKLIDVRLWGSRSRLSYIDSDILFFRKPTFLVDALHGKHARNYFNRDIADGYVLSAEEIERRIGTRPYSRLNAGLWIMHADDIDLDRIEMWLNHAGFQDCLYAYTLDQTFISMLANSSESGVEHLPSTYDVAFSKDVRTAVNKHYVGRIRHGYELEGLRYLLDECGFEERWTQFTGRAQAREHAFRVPA